MLLSDKLLQDIYYGCLSPQEHVFLNYVPTQYCVLVMLYLVIVIRHITILNNYFSDVYPIFVQFAMADVHVEVTVADVIVICVTHVYTMICLRCSSNTYLLLLMY